MNENALKMNIVFNKKSPQRVGSEIHIRMESESIMDYKVLIGNVGIWSTIKDFSDAGECIWNPEAEGNYIVMVQGKNRNSDKPYDVMVREEYIITDEKQADILIDINIDKQKYTEGEKIKVFGISEEKDILYRFWRKGKTGWELLRDYKTEALLEYTGLNPGTEEVLLECKRVDSKENFDDYKTIKFEIKKLHKLELLGFKCLTEEKLINEELVFKVEASESNNRTLLFKFVKIDDEGHAICIQDFSSRQIVSYQESIPGEYKLLCLMKDILSNKPFDDRAIMHYKVRPYNRIKINRFEADMKSPQKSDTDITFKVEAEGGRERVYRYIVDGVVGDDSCYTRSCEYTWTPREEGSYKITIYAKDASFRGDFEDKKTILFDIDKKGDLPVRIADIITDVKKESVINKPVNLRVIAEGGTVLQYEFIIYKDGKELEKIDFNKTNWLNFTPKEKGKYEIDIKIKDKYTRADYDIQTSYYLNIKEYMPGTIEHILMPKRDHYLVGEIIEIETIVQDTRNTLINFVTKINGNIVEETDFMTNKKISIKPKCSGKYSFEIFAKNIKCEEEYDSKREISIYVEEATPVIGTRIQISENKIGDNKEVTFKATSNGGKDVCYEFYLMERGNWIKAQGYSKKNYYTFIPYVEGTYKILVLSKSYYKRVNYEDYCEKEFTV